MSTFIIAEIGVNHNGDLNLALKMIKEAKNCGADAVKFQTFKTENFVNDKNLTYTYKSQGKEITEPQWDMFKRYEFTKEQWKILFNYCDELGIIGFTTPQDKSDLDFILSFYSPKFIKVGSDDLTNLPLLDYYASKGIPMIISSGMSYENEISDAINTIKSYHNNITVLHCISQYPTPSKDVNMNKLLNIKNKFNVQVGFSDHTIGSLSAGISVGLGATVIEKHFTLDKNLPGPDHWFSSDLVEMRDLVKTIREVELIMGNGDLLPTSSELEVRKQCRRSIVTLKNINKGDIINKDDLGFRRPGTGLPPKLINDIIGKTAIKDLKTNTIINFNQIK
jgi:N,N'-diacetyllegionaminate synthase